MLGLEVVYHVLLELMLVRRDQRHVRSVLQVNTLVLVQLVVLLVLQERIRQRALRLVQHVQQVHILLQVLLRVLFVLLVHIQVLLVPLHALHVR